jgi:hypothetical protein
MGEQRKGEGSRRINQFVGRRGSKKRAKGKEAGELTRSWEKEEQGKGEERRKKRN